MKKQLATLIVSILFLGVIHGQSILSFGISPTNSPEVNKNNLQKAIDGLSAKGGVIYIDPTETPYPISGGIILKKECFFSGC